MSMVLDSSATLAWGYADEVTEPIRRVFDQVIENGAWVPGLWKLEVANILEMGARRGRHNLDFRNTTLSELSLLPINVDAETDRNAWGTTLQLAECHRLTVYDAAYLELALRRSLPQATLDAEPRAVAQPEGVVVLWSRSPRIPDRRRLRQPWLGVARPGALTFPDISPNQCPPKPKNSPRGWRPLPLSPRAHVRH